ncbi:DNA repair helicase rad25 [Spizellomyces punctatus DAOM BR117]|uniref:DNA 3'-5' helicase n=1 Tax=Spizellomyces punctatus (strain DAOM BR117) TaxID=645134 RepID=A0A0L0H8G3_SPIPD|nr:DNA repair helicase rad25 [Spizellomyces punctatus DAOM BR117]KNC97502.1 DNA repair helicase rad25 [Spizellomyces punctatus DAOM BR117]|eukprot:XP_016605542.1 DNA repair helicase rad25 [Spizellomyces punctatus DAOM BR117]
MERSSSIGRRTSMRHAAVKARARLTAVRLDVDGIIEQGSASQPQPELLSECGDGGSDFESGSNVRSQAKAIAQGLYTSHEEALHSRNYDNEDVTGPCTTESDAPSRRGIKRQVDMQTTRLPKRRRREVKDTQSPAPAFLPERVYSPDDEAPEEDDALYSATIDLGQFEEAISDLFESEDLSFAPLKADHESRPLWVCQDGRIILEAFSPIAEQAQDFLVAISEPVTRPSHVHEYRLSEYSLYAAVSVGLDTDGIIQVLDRLSKTQLPPTVEKFIRENTQSYGKVKLVLKQNRYWIESADEMILQTLLKDEKIRECRLALQGADSGIFGFLTEQAPDSKGFTIAGSKGNEQVKPNRDDARQSSRTSDPALSTGQGFFIHEKPLSPKSTVEISHVVDEVLEGIDLFELFSCDPDDDLNPDEMTKYIAKPNGDDATGQSSNGSKDIVNPNLDVDLKATTKLRPYQERSLSKMFGNGRAKSGIIVLPCGAGKTLVGVTAACTIKKSCLVLCTSSVSVEQWAKEFRSWSTVREGQIAKFTSQEKEKFVGDAGILISTYTMVTYSGKRAYDAQQMMDFIRSREWGFLLLDEVHVVPADMFRKVLTIVAAHAKLGLTATLVREDDKIGNLNYLIGPKLYEANWLDLSRKGHIANVQCAEVWCNMTPEFYREYLREKSRRRQLLYAMNPRKLQACQYLIDFHESRGDKIIVFSDNVFALKHYATKLNKPYIYGGTSPAERMRVLHQFQHNPAINTIFLSKVGDTSIDLPEATCLIQVSSHYGSRRQEAQRLGRILRAKQRTDDGINAYFYSLVSRDTEEVYYSAKRQRFLIDQGYQFKVINKLEGLENISDLVYATRAEQLELLNTVLVSTEVDEDDSDILPPDDIRSLRARLEPVVVRRSGTLQSLSGGDSMAYIEYSKTSTSGITKEKRSLFYKNWKSSR